MCYLLGVTGLRDKVVLVTGASGGIGEAIAVEFARGGAVVVVSSRNEECGWRGRDGLNEIGILERWSDEQHSNRPLLKYAIAIADYVMTYQSFVSEVADGIVMGSRLWRSAGRF